MSEMNFSLWDFSLRVYAQPGIATLCLALQDTYGADINILLWCLWLEQEQKILSTNQLLEAMTLVAPWANTTIKPLRQMRSDLKKQYGTTDPLIENLRQGIKHAELYAEQQEQWLLQRLATDWCKDVSDTSPSANVHLYCDQLHIPAAQRQTILTQLHNAANKD